MSSTTDLGRISQWEKAKVNNAKRLGLGAKAKAANLNSEWSFSLRGGCQSSDSDSDSDSNSSGEDEDNENKRRADGKEGGKRDGERKSDRKMLTEDAKLMRELDIATRAETDKAKFEYNPWSIARVNAASRPARAKAALNLGEKSNVEKKFTPGATNSSPVKTAGNLNSTGNNPKNTSSPSLLRTAKMSTNTTAPSAKRPRSQSNLKAFLGVKKKNFEGSYTNSSLNGGKPMATSSIKQPENRNDDTATASLQDTTVLDRLCPTSQPQQPPMSSETDDSDKHDPISDSHAYEPILPATDGTVNSHETTSTDVHHQTSEAGLDPYTFTDYTTTDFDNELHAGLRSPIKLSIMDKKREDEDENIIEDSFLQDLLNNTDTNNAFNNEWPPLSTNGELV